MSDSENRPSKRAHEDEEDEDSIRKVRVANQAGLAGAVADHYNQLQNQGMHQRRQSRIFYLRNFNNWVKSMLIGEFHRRLMDDNVSEYRPTVLDMGCGKGGDLLKWRKADIGHLVCVDIAETSVEQCRGRYNEMRERNQRDRHPQHMFTAEFIAADCTRVRVCEQLRRPQMQFDLVSVQFVLHYSFESLPQAERMLENVTDRLKPGGFFIATIPNAAAIMSRLERAGGEQFGNEVFSVQLREPGRRLPLFGAQYEFFLEGVVDCPEFLVHLPLLAKLAKRYDLELVYQKRFDEMFSVYQTSSDGRMLLGKMQALEAYPAQPGTELQADAAEYDAVLPDGERCVGTMSRSEWEACSLYQAVAFRKVKPAVSRPAENHCDAPRPTENHCDA